MVVAQLIERSLPTPRVRASNPDNGKTYIECFLSTVFIEKTQLKKIRAVNGPFKRT